MTAWIDADWPAPRGVRADERNGFDRRKCLNQPVGAMMLVQLKGPPKITFNTKASLRLLEVPLGQRRRIYGGGSPL